MHLSFLQISFKKENLPSNQVSVVPIKDLVAFQEGMALKIAPHLTAAAIGPNHFEKMKVGPALNVFSRATSAGLKYMVQQENRPLSYMTTAWFLEQIDKWFDLMSTRNQDWSKGMVEACSVRSDNGNHINSGHTGRDAVKGTQVCVNLKVHSRLP